MNILENRSDKYIILDKGQVSTIPKNPYNILKIERFKGDRIMYKFNDDNEINETYDNGIFNCKVKGSIIQVRDYIPLSEAILTHELTGNMGYFLTVCSGILSKNFNVMSLKPYLEQYAHRLKFNDDEIIIDDFFKVNKTGSAYVLNSDNTWKYLCIVPNDNNAIQGHILEKNGLIDMSIIILSKIMYLFKPDLSDPILTRQLPEYIKVELERK